MSNRLKRRLNDLGVDAASSKANESFCLIGTPLPPLDKSKDLGEFVPLWKQEVRDEKGRRRLHGAFTGGFSAGYFNTVGSKEGWTPSAFVSSRGDRAKTQVTRPEDFMDEEDLQELHASRIIVDTTQEMDLTGGTAAELSKQRGGGNDEQDTIVHALQSTLFPSPTDSVGAQILKRMGWRLGNGVGPRVSLRQRRLQDIQASSPYGTRAVIDSIEITEEDEEANKHTYAPRDTPILIVERKDNLHGIGYQPRMTLHESLGSANPGSSKDARISSGFGLGALNDADEDDIDVYDAGLDRARNRLAYDTQHADDILSLGGKNNHSKLDKRSAAAQSVICRDGTRVLSGFVLSEKPVLEDRWFPLPDIPSTWKPNPQSVWGENIENTSKPEVKREPLDYEEWKASGLTAGERGNLLGETPMNTGPRSVFDYISIKDRERLKMIATATASGLPVPALPLPRTEPHIAEAALKGFQPFISDPQKQERYTIYLRSQINTDGPLLQALPNQRPDEFQKEAEDYAKAARIFKPASGAMAGRFQSATHIEQGPKIHEGLHQPTAAELEASEERRKKEEEEKLSPQEHAAKLGMYGPMTREVKPWQPARLLCKRFGLKEPEMSQEDVNMSSSSTKGLGFTASEAEESLRQVAGTAEASPSTQPQVQSNSNGPRNLANIGLGEDENQGRDTLTYQRPAMDIFKAIFASDDEDSDYEKVDDEESKALVEKQQAAVGGVALPLSHSLLDNGPMDLSNFKPTFKPRTDKAKKENDGGRIKSKKGKKEKKKKEKKGPIVSFDVEEGVDGESSLGVSKEPPKRRRKHHRRHDDDDDGMWVEKPPPEIGKSWPSMAQGLQASAPSALGLTSVNETDAVGNARKERKRAIDFL